MINFDAFTVLHKKYNRTDMPFLLESKERAMREKKYEGLKILQNIPLTLEAVLKVEPLLLGGADVTVSCISILEPNPKAIEILEAANVKIQLNRRFNNDNFDFCLDCGGELVTNGIPKRGMVELTQTGSQVYKKNPNYYPIISVDDSKLKKLETLFGTGDSFIRALKIFSKEEIYNKKFVIFGYGKVGQGIVHALIKFTDDISVVDCQSAACQSAARKGVKVIQSTELAKIKQEIKNAYCVVTATGVKDIMSTYYQLHKKDFANAMLANMGAMDEYGAHFAKEDVLFEKRPLNFLLSEPTILKYLDPILYAHNFGIDLILEGKVKSGYNAFPNDVASAILNKWAQIHKENIKYIDEYLT